MQQLSSISSQPNIQNLKLTWAKISLRVETYVTKKQAHTGHRFHRQNIHCHSPCWQSRYSYWTDRGAPRHVVCWRVSRERSLCHRPASHPGVDRRLTYKKSFKLRIGKRMSCLLLVISWLDNFYFHIMGCIVQGVYWPKLFWFTWYFSYGKIINIVFIL